MLAYLIAVSLLIPANLWAAITPHLHSEVSMRILHGLSTLALLPLLWQLWMRRKQDLLLFSLVLAVFLLVMVVVNGWITFMGMGVRFGWLDHIFLAVACSSVIAYFFAGPSLSQDG